MTLTDSAGGTQKFKVEDVEGTAASDLNIKRTAIGTTIDGSFEKTIAVTAFDTLQTLQTKINDLNWGVTASIINDGSSLAPFRLALNAKNSGRDGRSRTKLAVLTRRSRQPSRPPMRRRCRA